MFIRSVSQRPLIYLRHHHYFSTSNLHSSSSKTTRRMHTLKLLARGLFIASTGGGTYYYYYGDELGKSIEATGRVCRATFCAAAIAADYRLTRLRLSLSVHSGRADGLKPVAGSNESTGYKLETDLNNRPNEGGNIFGTAEAAEDAMMRAFHLRSAEKLLQCFSANRGIYIKLGQHLASLDYILPPEYTNVLRRLYDCAPQSTRSEVERVFEEEMQAKHGKRVRIEDVFEEWDEKPLGTASLAQVHRGRLKDDCLGLDPNFKTQEGMPMGSAGRDVAVKIQHASVRRHAMLDIATLKMLIHALKYVMPDLASFDWLVDELRHNLPKEMNFVEEGRNADRTRGYVEQDAWLKERVIVPRIFWPATTPRVIVQQLIDPQCSAPVTDEHFRTTNGIRGTEVVEILARLYAMMIFDRGFVHCDPHPGNLHLTTLSSAGCCSAGAKGVPGKAWRLALLDHGLYRTLSKDFCLAYARFWASLLSSSEDREEIRRASEGLGGGPAYKLLFSMMTKRAWSSHSSTDQDGSTSIYSPERPSSISKLVRSSAVPFLNRSHPIGPREIELIRLKAPRLFHDISELLAKVPRPLLLIMKTNDLLGALERKLLANTSNAEGVGKGWICTRGRTVALSPTITVMAKKCIHVLKQDELAHTPPSFKRIDIRIKWWWKEMRFWLLAAMMRCIAGISSIGSDYL